MISRQLSFLEAAKVIRNSSIKELPKKYLRILSSAQLSQLNIYLKALYAKLDFSVQIEELEFGTLRQSLIENKFTRKDEETIIILMPWDFIESFNWRTGIPLESQNIEVYKNEISSFFSLCKGLEIHNIKFIYLDFQFPNFLLKRSDIKIIKNQIDLAAHSLSCKIINNDFFCLSNYLSNGFPFRNKEVGKVAFLIFEYIINQTNQKKIIVLDLDFTLWNGILGEDGPSGINASTVDNGYLFFIFQSFIKNLKNNGILLAIVSKNDLDLIDEAFKVNNFVLKQEDFVKIIGTYEPKSLQIKNILKSINLTADACLFIDDNELEIEEVKNSSSEITCEKFPENINDLPAFIENLRNYFDFDNITLEDKNRTNLYKSKIDSLSVLKGKHGCIDDYLKSLKQILNIRKGDPRNIDRAIQLINKTNQFNLNGIRRSKEEILKMINEEYNIYIGELLDKNGSQGEIVVILVQNTGLISSFVMSCRVFQRKIEYAILYGLKDLSYKQLNFEYLPTKRNSPFLKFAEEISNLKKNNNFLINLTELKSNAQQIKNVIDINII